MIDICIRKKKKRGRPVLTCTFLLLFLNLCILHATRTLSIPACASAVVNSTQHHPRIFSQLLKRLLLGFTCIATLLSGASSRSQFTIIASVRSLGTKLADNTRARVLLKAVILLVKNYTQLCAIFGITTTKKNYMCICAFVLTTTLNSQPTKNPRI